MDVRIDPEVSAVTLAGVEMNELALFLGGVPRGAAAILTGPDGLVDPSAVEIMNLLAQHGFESVLVRPAGDAASSTAATSDNIGAAMVRHAVERLQGRDWTQDQIGVLGYGNGARAALIAASRTTFGAAVSMPRHPEQLLSPERVAVLHTPWLGLVGVGSRSTLSDELAAYRDEVAAASTEHTSLIGYPGVEHCLRDSTEPLEHTAAFDSWQRTAEWLNIHVAPRPTPRALAWQHRLQATRPTLN